MACPGLGRNCNNNRIALNDSYHVCITEIKPKGMTNTIIRAGNEKSLLSRDKISIFELDVDEFTDFESAIIFPITRTVLTL